MKLVSYLYNAKPGYGLFKNGRIFDLTSKIGHTYPDLKSLISAENVNEIVAPYLHKDYPISEHEIDYLPIIPNPNKILCIGMNYQDKKQEFQQENIVPVTFIRFADSQTGHNTKLIKPRISNQFDYEGELAVIIGKDTYLVSESQALEHVAGYSCYMDGSIRDWQHNWFTAGKNWPKTGAIGPYLTTRDEIADPQNLTIKTWLNHQQVQYDNTKNMIFSVAKVIEYISTFTKLTAGDIILTGSPGGVGKKRVPPLFLQQGDIIEVEIAQLGKLRNYILEESILEESSLAENISTETVLEEGVKEEDVQLKKVPSKSITEQSSPRRSVLKQSILNKQLIQSNKLPV